MNTHREENPMENPALPGGAAMNWHTPTRINLKTGERTTDTAPLEDHLGPDVPVIVRGERAMITGDRTPENTWTVQFDADHREELVLLSDIDSLR